MTKAESLAPAVADYAYAEATLLIQRGDREGAIAAARRALASNPQHEAARDILRSVGN